MASIFCKYFTLELIIDQTSLSEVRLRVWCQWPLNLSSGLSAERGARPGIADVSSNYDKRSLSSRQMGLILQNTTTQVSTTQQLNFSRLMGIFVLFLEDIIWPLINLLQCRISMKLHIFAIKFYNNNPNFAKSTARTDRMARVKTFLRFGNHFVVLPWLWLASAGRGGSAVSGLAALGCCCLQLQSAMTLSPDRAHYRPGAGAHTSTLTPSWPWPHSPWCYPSCPRDPWPPVHMSHCPWCPLVTIIQAAQMVATLWLKLP